jgi:hypothetical protein
MDPCLQALDTIIKVECEGVVRRALLKGTPNYALVDRAVQEIWPQRSAREAKYVDDEGDACTLTERTFSDFICSAKMINLAQAEGECSEAGSHKVLRLVLPASTLRVDADAAPVATDVFSTPWQHVEQGGDDADEDGLHTVVDLTDLQDDRALPSSQEATGYPTGRQEAVEPLPEKDAAVPQEAPDPARDVSAGWELEEKAGATKIEDTTVPDEEKKEDVALAQKSDDFYVTDESLQDVSRRFTEHIDIVIAAFDEDGDGHLSFVESRALVRFTCGDDLPRQVFDQICADVGADAAVGLDRDALVCVYSCGHTWMVLENDFEAAKRKLQGMPADPRPRPSSAISMVLKNPLLAAPYALDVAERFRQGVASQIK